MHLQIMVMELKCKSMFKPTIVWQKGDAIVTESDRIKLLFTDEGNQVYRVAMEIKVWCISIDVIQIALNECRSRPKTRMLASLCAPSPISRAN